MAKLRDAQELHRLGWRVVAAPLAGKAPLSSWKAAQTEPATDEELQEAFKKDRNIFIITGAISQLAVLDCDDHTAIEYWRKRLGDVLDETTCVATGRGKHYYFRLAEGESHKGRSSPGGDSGKWDIRADGGGVVAPPSIHPTGRVYRWGQGRGPEALQDAPAELWAGEQKEGKPKTGPSSILSHLLANPPEEGGRNNWLAKVAGHYAKELKHQDAFEETVRGLGVSIGLDDEEIEKLIKSIWNAEQAKEGRAAPEDAPEGEGGGWRIREPIEDAGYLISGDTRILTQIRERDADGGWQIAIAPWLNADLRAIGIFEMPDESRLYHVEIRTPKRVYEGDVSSKTLGDSRQLVQWLAGFGVSLAAPDCIFPKGMASGARLVRYLEAQQPPVQLAVTALGWHEESAAFITHEGLLRADGYAPFEAVRPAPRVRAWAPYVYGLEGAEHTAEAVLSEVLTFHDERVAAVFGAWWAACLLKPQIAREFSQFPFMALEAPSESGKAEPLTNEVLTPTGWRLMGELTVGDSVIGSNGKPTMITGIFPQGITETVTLTLKDRTQITCSPDHLWKVILKENKQRVVTTTDIAELLRQGASVSLPTLSAPVEYEQRESLPIEPYALGALLGDGHFTADYPNLTTHVDDLPEMRSAFSDIGTLTFIKQTSRNGVAMRIKSPALRRELRLLRLWGATSSEKFVPSQYLIAPIEDRYKLLRGLMDTDGTCTGRGSCEFCSTSLELAQAVQQLVRSLGGYASMYTREIPYGDNKICVAYRIQFTIPECPFVLARKAARWNEQKRQRRRLRRIVSAEYGTPTETKCIRVAAEDNLYVTGGDGFVVTHNTTGYFPLMLELAGNTQGNSNPTRAAMRDYLSAHRSGIVWVDDLDNLDALGELIRSTTVEGSVVKKALNQSDQISVQLVAALCVSGESLGLHGQKALLDRSIGLEVPSPVGRRSLHGDYSQFQDIVEMKRKHPNLYDFAGTYVTRALKLVPEIPAKALELREGDGRLMDKLTIMRLGCWILRSLIDHESSDWVERHVEGWVAEQTVNYDPTDNSLTMQLLPAALKRLGRPTQPLGPDASRSRPASPVFIRAQEQDVWVNPTTLAEWFSDVNYGRVDKRTASAEALRQQMKAIGAGGKKGTDRRYFKYSTGSGGANYWRIPDEIAKQVLRRAEE